MSNQFYAFPSIGQFNNVIRYVKSRSDFKGLDESGEPIYVHDFSYPTIKFKGTVKLHGTNAAIIFPTYTIKDFYCQSRERLITCQSDNAGFCAFIYALPIDVLNILFAPQVGVYGEWCGGNIQKGVGINGLTKMFVIFNEKSLDEETIWISEKPYNKETLEILNKHNIYHINQFKSFEIDIDFEHPEIAQNELVRLTEEVEKECPVAKYFKPDGTDLVGEGIVWHPVGSGYDSGYWFKVKGEKHSVTKHKTLAPVDVEVVKEIEKLVDMVITDGRVDQGIQKLKEVGKPFEMTSMGDFLRWMVADVEKEESEMLDKSGIERKKLYGKMMEKSKKMFVKRLV